MSILWLVKEMKYFSIGIIIVIRGLLTVVENIV